MHEPNTLARGKTVANSPFFITLLERPAEKDEGQFAAFIKQKSDEVDRIRVAYRAGRVTLERAADEVDVMALDGWRSSEAVRSRDDTRVDRAVADSETPPRMLGVVVPEYAAVLTLVASGRHAVMAHAEKRPVVAARTLEKLVVDLADRKLGNVRRAAFAVDVASDIEFLESAVEFIKAGCDVVPVEIALERESAEVVRLRQTHGDSFADSLLLAIQLGCPLYSDDECLAAAAAGEHGLVVVSSDTVLSLISAWASGRQTNTDR